jgi:ABC-2 type transport system permease protein
MHNIFLIAKREYVERVRSRAFLIMTIFIPALMFAMTAGPALLATRVRGGPKHLVLAVSDRQAGDLIREELEKRHIDPANNLNGKPEAPRFQVEVDTNASNSEHAALTEKVKARAVDGAIWATDEALAANKVTFITSNVSNLTDGVLISQDLSRAAQRLALHKKGLNETEIAAALKPLDVETVDARGGGPSNPIAAFIAPLVMAMIMYVTVLLYGINVMRAVLDEKTSRVMEVMLSTVTAREMMIGKIAGVGAAGLTQVGIWAAAAGIFSTQGLSMIGGAKALSGIVTPQLAICFPVFFLLGFTLFSTMYAAVGAMANSEQETQQLQFLVAMPLIASVIILIQVLQNQSTPLAFWASLFPFTAPLIMFTRIALDPRAVPVPQIILSIALLVATICGLAILCGRIYRVGILMYGKKPTLPEIMKWIKYS